MIDNQELDQNIDIPADTFSAIFKHSQKVRRNPLQDHFSLKINTAFLIAQSGIIYTLYILGIFESS